MVGFGKKANVILDSVLVVVVLFVLGLISVVGYMVLSDFDDSMQNDTSISDDAKNITRDMVQDYPTIWDGAIVFMVALLWIASIVSSFLIDSHPVFLVIAVLGLGFVIIFAGYMSNAFEDFADDSEISPYANQFPFTLWIFDHLVMIVLAIGFSIGIALYAKSQGVGDG